MTPSISHRAEVTGYQEPGSRPGGLGQPEDPGLHRQEMTARFCGISGICCDMDVRYHCLKSLPTLKQINTGPAHGILVEIEPRRIWLRQQNNTKGEKMSV